MKTYTVAILGATGAVGREMLRVLQERDFPVGRLIALGSERSQGTALSFAGSEIPVQAALPIMKRPSPLPRPSGKRERSLWIIHPPSASTPRCLWWCPRSIRRM